MLAVASGTSGLREAFKYGQTLSAIRHDCGKRASA